MPAWSQRKDCCKSIPKARNHSQFLQSLIYGELFIRITKKRACSKAWVWNYILDPLLKRKESYCSDQNKRTSSTKLSKGIRIKTDREVKRRHESNLSSALKNFEKNLCRFVPATTSTQAESKAVTDSVRPSRY